MKKNGARKVLITGVSRGLGRVMAEEFARLGHTVIGCGRSRPEIDDLTKQFPSPHSFAVVDISSDDQVERWAKQILKKQGVPQLVLNNAGVINRNAPLWKITAEEFAKVMDVNINGTVNVIRHFLPAMIEAGEGVVVNFSSGWGRSTDPEVAPYCASKWAIEGLSQALSQELPSGLVTAALNPGIIDTDMLRSTMGGSASGYISPQDWAKRTVPFLLGIGPEDNGKQLTAP